MQLETQVKGWKICLCLTEFIVRPELHTYLESIDPQLMGVRTQGYVIIETPEERTRGLDKRNLLLQRTHGYPEAIAPVTTILERSRLLHRYPTGKYLGGRHTSEYDASCPIDPNLPLAWFGWGLPNVKKQKNQALRDRFKKIIHLPLSPRKYAWVNGFGQHHCHSDEEIENNWQEQLKITENLTHCPHYNVQLQKIQELYSVRVEGT
jgi:hypothetical protein